MSKRRRSLTRSLLYLLLIPAFIITLVSAIVVFFVSRGLVQHAFDRSLRNIATGIGGNLAFSEGRAVIDLPPGAIKKLVAFYDEQIYFQAVNDRGEVIRGDSSIPAPPAEADEGFRDGIVDGQRVRIVLLRPEQDPSRRTYVQVAETYSARNAIVETALAGVLLPEIAIVVILVISTCVGVRSGLAPLDAIVQTVTRRSPRDLRPVDIAQSPEEVEPLLRAFNGLLGQIDEDQAGQRRFVENASHQLRTPLAGVKAQIELIQRELPADHLERSFRGVSTSLDRMTRLVQQLLGLARSGNLSVCDRSRAVDIQKLAIEVTADFASLASSRKIDLGFEGCTEENVKVLGDTAALRELLANLIENAVQYTPENGTVTVGVAADTEIILSVEDNGLGIPEASRGRVFERFYRVPRKGPHGSGLGLAIVEEIAIAHGRRCRSRERRRVLRQQVLRSIPAVVGLIAYMKLHIVMHESFESPAAIEVWAIRNDFEINFTRLYEGDTIPECCEFDFLLVMGGPQSPITTREECVYFDSERGNCAHPTGDCREENRAGSMSRCAVH
jgi:two-component system sensor histidine kinase TctE